MIEQVKAMAFALKVRGLMNTQLAVQGDDIYVIEVNPRASRTVPYVSKATGRALAKIAARVMAGETLAQQGVTGTVIPGHFCVKESVFPFSKFQGVDPILGPEMKSTGEVMGVGKTFAEAFAKSQLGASVTLPTEGKAFLSVREPDKAGGVELAQQLVAAGFSLVATSGTAAAIEAAGIACERVNKVHEGRPHIVDAIVNGEIALIVNTTEGRKSIGESMTIRRSALQQKVTYYTTIAGGKAAVAAIESLDSPIVTNLQELHADVIEH